MRLHSKQEKSTLNRLVISFSILLLSFISVSAGERFIKENGNLRYEKDIPAKVEAVVLSLDVLVARLQQAAEDLERAQANFDYYNGLVSAAVGLGLDVKAEAVQE